MTMWKNGNNPEPYTLAAACVAYTPAKVLADGRATPCEAGDPCNGIFNATRDAGDGIGLLAPWNGKGVAVMALAAGAVTPGHKLVVAIGTDDIPKFADVDDAEVGDIIVGESVLGLGATAEDLADADGVFTPSLAVRLFDTAVQTAVPAP
jgi:hypothetical protein